MPMAIKYMRPKSIRECRKMEFKWYTLTDKVKIKCTLVQALKLCTGRTTHRGSRGIALPFYGHDTKRG